MKGNVLVSVIIPVFNVKPFLVEALDSILSQTYNNLEIVVIDDGSTDGSEEICDEYAVKDNRIIVIHQENKGLSSARNAGLDIASGQIIAFLDSDDAFHPKMIQILLDEMRKNKTDIAICGFSVQKTQNKMKTDNLESEINSLVIHKKEAFQRILDGYINTAVWDKLYDSTIWKNLRFPDGYVYEGTYIVFDIFDKAKRISLVNDNLVMHRERQGSICQTFSLKNILDGEYALSHYFSFIKKHTPEIFSSSQLERFIQNRIHRNIATYLQYSYIYPEDEEGKQKIRKTLLNVGKEWGISNCSLFIKVTYIIISLFPNFSNIVYYRYKCLKKVFYNKMS